MGEDLVRDEGREAPPGEMGDALKQEGEGKCSRTGTRVLLDTM